MDAVLKVQLLTDKRRLQEIYDLRVYAWENSRQHQFINKYYFPQGWSDGLDKDAFHWIIEINGNIIASSRVCVLRNMEHMNEDFSMFKLPDDKPFAFYSRLVIHPMYRGKGITHLMDNARIEFIKENRVAFTLAWAREERLETLYKLGFTKLGHLNHKYHNYSAPDKSTALILFLDHLIGI